MFRSVRGAHGEVHEMCCFQGTEEESMSPEQRSVGEPWEKALTLNTESATVSGGDHHPEKYHHWDL